MELGYAGTGAAAFVMHMLHLIHFLFLLCCLNGVLIIFGSLALLKSNGSRRAVRQTVSEAVAEVLSDQLGLTIYDIDGSFMAGIGTKTAAVAFIFIDLDNLTDHYRAPPLIFLILWLDYSMIKQTMRLYLQRKWSFYERICTCAEKNKIVLRCR